MSVRSAVVGTGTVAALLGALGNPVVVDDAHDLAVRHASPTVAATVTGFPSWDVFDGGTAETAWGIGFKLVVLLAIVAVLTAAAGRASRRAAFLAGWASLVVAAAVTGALHYTYQQAVVLDGQNPTSASYLDNLMEHTNAGAAFGLWTGWLVGAAVTATVHRPAVLQVPARNIATRPIARSPGGRPITPPAPWWAADTLPRPPLRYSPTSVFPSADRAAVSHRSDDTDPWAGPAETNPDAGGSGGAALSRRPRSTS